MYRHNNYETKPYMIEKIVSGLSYLTMGFVGFIWLIISLVRRTPLTKFLQYHIFQSIFISIGYVLLCLLLGLLLNIMSMIPFINLLAAQIALFFNAPIFFGYSIIQTAIYVLLFYLAITSFMGMYSRIPWISNIIDMNVR
ncbi:TPA: hypothetical protein IAD41_00800 [Candidatus Scatenecus faecavium]|uniref:DUF4870 domain-containing protein n=1 Tax=Candidatus Scatenecus faecavium TaxID=2840915 RepID=A0A9D1K497_9BACT|nr:hypothetical protein [Candidatus Scatenecus faecavium]